MPPLGDLQRMAEKQSGKMQKRAQEICRLQLYFTLIRG